jgi:mRNA-degrading endonuclease YafQ of YafQ-DinJ toxin-antitoxin module
MTNPVYYAPAFIRHFKNLPKDLQKEVSTKEKMFRKNLFDPQLKTHKLTGRLGKYYSFSVTYHHRILFAVEKRAIVFIDIGTHSVYR